MVRKLNPFYKLLKAEVSINITSELKETFDSVNKALSDACELALKQPIPGKQPVLMTDANFKRRQRLDDWRQSRSENPIKKEDLLACCVWIEKFLPRTTKNVDLLERSLRNLHGFHDFAHNLCEATKPTIVLTDNKSLTRFFQAKAFPPSFWNACDYVLQFIFKIAHIAGSVNRAADFLSR